MPSVAMFQSGDNNSAKKALLREEGGENLMPLQSLSCHDPYMYFGNPLYMTSKMVFRLKACLSWLFLVALQCCC